MVFPFASWSATSSLRVNSRYISYLQAVQFCSRIHAEQTETIVKLEAFLVQIIVHCLYFCVKIEWRITL